MVDAVLSTVSSLDKPIDFLDPSDALKNNCLSILPRLFSLTTSCCGEGDVPIDSLHTKGYGLEDVWQQIEMVNSPLLSRIKNLNLDSIIRNGSVSILNLEANNEDHSKEPITAKDSRDIQDESMEEGSMADEKEELDLTDEDIEELESGDSEKFEEEERITDDHFLRLAEQAEKEAALKDDGEYICCCPVYTLKQITHFYFFY